MKNNHKHDFLMCIKQQPSLDVFILLFGLCPEANFHFSVTVQRVA